MPRAITRKLDVFQRQSDLEKLLKDLKKLNKDALGVLQKGLSSDDEKIRVNCADKILAFTESVSKSISQDQLNRLIADIKIGQNQLTAVPEKKSGPLLDFTTISPEFAEKDEISTVDFSQVNSIG